MGYYEAQQQRLVNHTKRLVNVAVYSNKVIICGQTINRPSDIAPSQWFDLWESFAA